jgi:hypothetical protein
MCAILPLFFRLDIALILAASAHRHDAPRECISLCSM